MRAIRNYPGAEQLPDLQELFAFQGIPFEADLVKKYGPIQEQARSFFLEQAAPVGLFEEIAIDEFSRIYEGEGGNSSPSPLGQIFPQARSLALFSATLGPGITRTIGRLFQAGEFPVAYALDALASLGAEKTVARLQMEYSTSCREALGPDELLVRYSPGYCGWNVTGQKKLFARLKPEEIGVTLRDSSLMDPLKTVSGVFVRGRKEIHGINGDFSCCKTCSHGSCQWFGQRATGYLHTKEEVA